MVRYLRYLEWENGLPIEAAWVEIPEEKLGESWEKYITEKVYGTEAIFKSQCK
jgi:hypothetical protein